MYLSQLALNPRSRQVKSECADPYQMHRTLCRAWGDECKAAQILYRVEPEQERGFCLLVQSHLEPDWGFLQGDYLLRGAQVKPFEPQLQAGQRLTFRLRANPTKSAIGPEQTSGRGKREGLFREAERRDWLLRQAARCGFEIPIIAQTKEGPVYDLRQLDERALTATPQGPAREKRAVLSSVLFEGRLEITDADVFQAALQNGIGRGKAFGFGLLSLRRANN